MPLDHVEAYSVSTAHFPPTRRTFPVGGVVRAQRFGSKLRQTSEVYGSASCIALSVEALAVEALRFAPCSCRTSTVAPCVS
jgi:hypothetical protein